MRKGGITYRRQLVGPSGQLGGIGTMTPRVVRTLAAALCAGAALAGCSTDTDQTQPAASGGEYADIANSPACTTLRQDHAGLAGKTMRNAINPYTPGYETVDPT